MKTKRIISTVVILLFGITAAFAANRTIKGNGNAVKKVIPIGNYEEISIAGNASFEYTQSTDAPYLEITLDDNLFDYVEVKVEGKALKIGPKKAEGMWNGKSSYNLQPTIFKIKSNSKALRKLNTAGSGNFIVNSSLSGNDLELNSAGSGNVQLPNAVSVDRVKLNLAGSGSIQLSRLKASEASCNVAGSGTGSLGGTATEASFSLSGSGKIKAYDCKAQTASCSIAGSGSAEVNAEKKLSASIVGSGNVYYKGNPEIKKSVMGSGKVKEAY